MRQKNGDSHNCHKKHVLARQQTSAECATSRPGNWDIVENVTYHTHIIQSSHTAVPAQSDTESCYIHTDKYTFLTQSICFTFIISRSMPSPERQWTRQYKNKDIFKSVNNAIISKFWLYVTHVMNKKIIISKIGGTNTEQNTIRNYCIRAQRLYIHRLY